MIGNICQLLRMWVTRLYSCFSRHVYVRLVSLWASVSEGILVAIKGGIRVLDSDSIAYKSPAKWSYWTVCTRDDSIVIEMDGEKVLFYIREREKIHDAARRLASITGWHYLG